MHSALPNPGETTAALLLAQPGVRRVWVEQFLPLRDASGAVVGVSVVAEEVTAQRLAEAERERAERQLRESEQRLAMALEAGQPLGFLLTRAAADEAEIIIIGSRPSIQRRGVARQLLSHHLMLLAANGIRHLFLEVAASNIPAQALYASCGFAEAGRRRGYYTDGTGGRIDALVLTRPL